MRVGTIAVVIAPSWVIELEGIRIASPMDDPQHVDAGARLHKSFGFSRSRGSASCGCGSSRGCGNVGWDLAAAARRGLPRGVEETVRRGQVVLSDPTCAMEKVVAGRAAPPHLPSGQGAPLASSRARCIAVHSASVTVSGGPDSSASSTRRSSFSSTARWRSARISAPAGTRRHRRRLPHVRDG
jgi:hypothetical protein